MPSLGMVTLNALAAADSVIIPVQAQYLPAKGMTQLMQTIGKVRQYINPSLRIDGILLNIVDNRTNLAKSTADALRKNFGSVIKIYRSYIPMAVKAAEVASKGVSIYKYEPSSPVAKAYIFYKRTIKPHTPVTSVDTSSEALAVSMGEKARVDMDYMCELTGKTEEEIFADLKGVIFLNPMHGYGNSTQAKYLMADEYLSGNVREKLALARKSAELYPEDYTVNVEALERVQPKDLTASEIAVRLGATWLPTEIVEQFMFEFLGTPRYAQWNIKVHFSAYTGEWNIEGKSYDRSNVKAYSTYGTGRINAYKIIEETLNLKDVRIFDYVEDADGKKKAILNKKETAIAQAKQELIKQGFQDWVWSDPERRERLCILYNEKFNSLRPREYDGSHIVFSGMNPEIELREHQRNAVAHILYGGNTLLAHAVGAGKSATRS